MLLKCVRPHISPNTSITNTDMNANLHLKTQKASELDWDDQVSTKQDVLNLLRQWTNSACTDTELSEMVFDFISYHNEH